MSQTTMLSPVPWKQVRIDGPFWAARRETNRTVTLPLEYDINVKNGVLDSYVWDWRGPSDELPPWRPTVGDLGKWIEAASYSLATHPDEALAAQVEDAIRHMLAGQKEDGYLYPNPLRRGQRWANLQEYHELYEVGHDVEAAVAHFQATGERRFLDAISRFADLVAAHFGTGEGQIRGYDGHPEVELALVKLYRATGERRYLDLARFFVDERGRAPLYFEAERQEIDKRGLPYFGWIRYLGNSYAYMQAHKPLREQEEAVGHAVRALYLYAGMADVAAETGDRELLAACKRLWQSVTQRRMYVTGGVGSSARGELFTFDYDLPNETAYAETCANIALVFFAHRLLQIEADAEYADVLERALYNGVLSGVSLDGRQFFYSNPLTVYPAPEGDRLQPHLAGVRQGWFGCACCPPNIARLLASLGGYVYSTGPDALYVHLYVAGSAACELGGRAVTVHQETGYPYQEDVRLTLEARDPVELDLALRLPGWCRRPEVRVNGAPVDLAACTRGGYAHLRRVWQPGDRADLHLPMPVERVEANPAVRMDCGKVTLQRGPLVYCLEQVDNGPNLADISLPRQAMLTSEHRPDLLGGTVVIRGTARRRCAAGWEGQLYRAQGSETDLVDITAVPYCLWANRAPGEMIVWIRENQ